MERHQATRFDAAVSVRSASRKALDPTMNIKRMRGRNHRGGNGGGGGGGGSGPIRHHGGGIPLNRNHVFDSSGPDLRIRGTAQQLFEKYLQLGRDATGSGDRVMAESYFQHAEHYFRILNAMAQAAQQPPQQQNGQHPPRRQTMQDANGPEPSEETDEEDDQPSPTQFSASRPGRTDTSGTDTRDIPIAPAPPES